MLGRPRVGLDGGDARRRAAEVAERRGEQTDAAVQVEVPRVGIDRRAVRARARARLAATSSGQRVRGEPVHLPEPAGVDAEVAAADALDDDLARGIRLRRARPVGRRASAAAVARSGRGMTRTRAVGGLHEVDATRACRAASASAARSTAAVASGRSSTGMTRWLRAANGPTRPSASTCRLTRVRQPVPSGDSSAIDARRRPRAARSGASIATGTIVEPPMRCSASRSTSQLQLPLVREVDVPEVRAARAQLRRRRRCRPDARRAGGGGARHPGSRAPRRARTTRSLSPTVGQPHAHALARDRVGDEDDAPLVPADEDAAVGDSRDVEVDERRRRPACRSVHGLEPTVEPCACASPRPRPPGSCCCSSSASSPLTIAPDVDEEAVIASVEAAEGRTLAPDEHVLLLARRKAAEVAARLADDIPDFDGIVIGGDSMFELDGEVLGKPHTAENATARWRAMRGRTGVLHSGHAVVRLRTGRRARARRTRWPRHPSPSPPT